MESSSLGIPRTPNRAASEGPSPPPRNSMEDADSSVTRKRPRLDSGERAYRSMSADGSLSTPSRAGPGALLPHSNDGDCQQGVDQASDVMPAHTLDGTPSKVTINVRDSVLTSSPTHAASPRTPLPHDVASEVHSPSTRSHTLDHSSPSPPMITRISSSPPRSPEIEIAELEDIDGHSGPTVWRTSDSIMSIEELQNNLMDEFPLAEHYNNIIQAVAVLSNQMLNGDLGDGSILCKLAGWIDTYLDQTKHFSSQWFNMITDMREFWDKLPNIAMELLRRSLKFDEAFIKLDEQEDDHDNRQYIEQFFAAYFALTARMVQIDCQTLCENAEDTVATPDLVSPLYLRMISYSLFNQRDLPLWKMLHSVYSYPVMATIQAVVTRFTQPPSCAFQCLSQYVSLLLDRSQNHSSMVADVWQPVNIANRVTQCFPRGRVQPLPPGNKAIVTEAFHFFEATQTKLEAFITKQVSSLNLDLTKNLITELSSILRHVILADESFVDVMKPANFNWPRQSTLDERALFIEFAWKFGLCKKCITQGRMEIRVQGIDTMQVDLVCVYQRYIETSGCENLHMTPQYLSESILESKLVDYIVGVESHPQLISRSKNILGFLVVTGKYTKAESDLVWRTVCLSPDSRTIDAVLDMVSGILNIMHLPQLLYLCEKLIGLPIRYFDGRMLAYCKSLRDVMVKKWIEKEGTYGRKLDVRPYRLYLRLIREAIADTSLTQPRQREIYQTASEELRYLMHNGPSELDTTTIYEECVADVSDRSPFASGSVAALNIFLEYDNGDKIESLAAKSNFPALMVEEFSSFLGQENAKTAYVQGFHDTLDVRLSVLQRIITCIPETLSPDLAQKLWDSMVGKKALSDHARNAAWQILANGLTNSRVGNPFFDRCIQKQLPELNPGFLTWGVLHFAEKVFRYEAQSYEPLDNRQVGGLGLPGTELLWHICLVEPDSAIASKAIAMLVKAYLDSSDARRLNSTTIDGSNDAKLVERCIQQLNQAASKLKKLSEGTSGSEDDSMVIVPSENDVSSEKIFFTRSLYILKEFMHGIRSQLPGSPASSKSQSPYSINGENISISYQLYSGGSSTGIKKIEIGDLATLGDLVARLVKLTGFSKFILIVGGGRVDQEAYHDTTLRDLKLHKKGLVFVQKAPNAEIVREDVGTTGLRPLEVEVMKHFHELYDLLGIDQQLGQDVFDFLGTFPPHEDITSLVCNESTLAGTIFPSDAPYKALYSVYALKFCLTRQLQDGTTCHGLIRHGVRSIVAAVLASQLPESSEIYPIEVMTAIGLIECLLRFLKEPVPLDVSATYFDDAHAFVDRLHQLISAALVSQQTPQTIHLIYLSFAVMLEASLYSKPVWQCYKQNSSLQLLRSLLLESPYEKLRQGVASSIQGVCGSLPSVTATDPREFVLFFWQSFVSLIPHTVQLNHYTENFFSIALAVFRRLDEEAQEQLPLDLYVQTWSKLLLEHPHDEFIGRESVDWIVYGVTGLLHWCIQLLKAKKRPLNIDIHLAEMIFYTHLFPQIHGTDSSSTVKPQVPVLDSATRGRLYSVLLALSTETSGYRGLLDLVKDLLPQGEDSHAWDWGVAQILEDYHYEANWNFERMKSIRAPTGYPGIRNLSNTCYLNSLFTQLFMNVGFRRFMLTRSIADGQASQRLLAETQKFFAAMQETWLKSVDPQGLADSIITYDSSPIDVAIQMDVDEFYNLLFDRWESQIPSAADKKTFRSFYGGQIVQQIKSNECEHISERLEPFSAIQCEIQGKATLAESLQAYVEGEVMEGENKYSCSSCGSYVNAVKRACLKDIPDNLIFHLKRFDYDLSTGMRNKINDHFAFPVEIDMSHYDVEYLKDPGQPIGEDNFTLVGVLVHSGNAESGHYYSYIRERPADCGGIASWVEFNDADVSRFDPNNIPDQCFGGMSDPVGYAPMRFPKSWNAYMLFYQRASSMEAERERHMPLTAGIPVKEKIPRELEARIITENELYIRKYCFFDPEHAKFIKSLLEHHRTLSKGLCSDDHGIEREIIWLALEHLDQVFSRAKDSPDFHNVLDMIIKIASTCAECCKLSLDWVSHHDSALRNMLLRSPDEEIRKRFSKMVVGALKYLRNTEPRLYGIDTDSIDQEQVQVADIHRGPGALQDLLARLKELLMYMHLHSRAWDDYYDLLNEIAQLGCAECALMHQEGFLAHCLEVLIVEYNNPSIKRLRHDTPHHAHYVRMLEKGRKFSLRALLTLLATLLNSADLDLGNFGPGQFQVRTKYRLTRHEESIIRFGSDVPRSKGLIFLDKAISLDCNPLACQAIIRIITGADPVLSVAGSISQMILSGISIDPASGARPYLHAALAFCEACRSTSIVRTLVMSVADEVDTIGHSGGEDHLEFFAKARRLRNEYIARKFPSFFPNLVLTLVPRWAPTLLLYPDFNVRNDTVNLLHTLVFSNDPRAMDDERQAELIVNTAKELCRACIKRITENIIFQHKQVEARTVDETIRVVRHCMHNYFNDEEEDDDGETGAEFIIGAEAVLEQLQNFTVSSPDDALSDVWDNGSDLPTDSESEPVFLSP